MALTKISTPSDYDSAYRPLVWEVQTDVSNLNSVEFELRNHTTSGTIATVQVQHKYGATNRFLSDMRAFVQDYLGNDIAIITPNGTAFDSVNSIGSFDVVATEKILSASGTFTDGATLTSSGFWLVNSSLAIGQTDLVTGDYFTTTSGTKLLTDNPYFETRNGESDFISLYNNGENVKMTVVATDIAGLTVTGVIDALTLSGQTCYLGIGYNNINAYTLDSGSQPLIDNETASYTVQFETVTTGTIFEQLSVTVDREYRPNATRFVFLNIYGSLDFFTAWSYIEESIAVNSLVSHRVVSDYTSVESYGKFKPSTTMRNAFVAGSQNLTYDQVQWLKQLFSSPSVWIQEGTSYRPIIINTNSVNISSSLSGREVFDLQFEYEFANDLRRQNG